MTDIDHPKMAGSGEVNSNNTCDSAAGISAIVYETNPMATLPTSPRLAPNTQVIDLTVTNKANRVVDVTGKLHLFMLIYINNLATKSLLF